MRTRKLKLGGQNITGQALMKLRTQKGIRTYQAANMLAKKGIILSESAISKIEGGHRMLNDDEMLAFSIIYDTSVDEIYKLALNGNA